MLTDLADACRKSGLPVVVLAGWSRNARPGTFAPRGILCHHTASSQDGKAYAEWMAFEGRSDLPAPLCQLGLGRDGTVYVLAAGRANHAGSADTQYANGRAVMPAGDGNALYLGIEAMHQGTDAEEWTETQYDAYVRLVATLCLHYGWPVERVRGHKETSQTGKIDPNFSMDAFRSAVAAEVADMLAKKPQRPAPARAAIITGKKTSAALGKAADEAAAKNRPGLARRYRQAQKATDTALGWLQKIERRP